jgi:hypothetical protein
MWGDNQIAYSIEIEALWQETFERTNQFCKNTKAGRTDASGRAGLCFPLAGT